MVSDEDEIGFLITKKKYINEVEHSIYVDKIYKVEFIYDKFISLVFLELIKAIPIINL